jgi:LPXTG-site transpeptidase (sortase) family protein
MKGIVPLVLIAVGVYVVYNFPALWDKLTYWLNPPKPGNSAMLPKTIGSNNNSAIPTGGPECGTKPIEYDDNGNPKRICDNYVYIPKIRVAAPIIRPTSTDENAIDQALLQGVVKYPGTAEPGEQGNVFLTGHSSYYWWVETDYRNVFSLEPELREGDEIIVYHNGIRYSYKVFTTFEVSPDNTGVLDQTPNPIVTLSTCVPVGTSYHRKIVQANQVSPDPNTARPTNRQAVQPARLPGVR